MGEKTLIYFLQGNAQRFALAAADEKTDSKPENCRGVENTLKSRRLPPSAARGVRRFFAIRLVR